MLPFISVIIPSYNRADLIGLTLQSLVEQDYPTDKYEVIVVDNNSTDNTKDVVRDWQARARISIKYVFETRQGVHYARNSGVQYAKGDILYYTDDDMLADRKLLTEIVKPFNYDPSIASVTGKVLPVWEVKPPDWVLKYCMNSLLSLNDKPEDLIIAKYDVGVFSCHQAIRREVFIGSGGFNPENTAGEWIGDGETGLNIKIKDMGYKFAYIGSSVIYHMIPPSRMTQAYLNKRLGNQGNCDSYTAYRANRYGRSQLKRVIVSHLQSMIVEVTRFLCKRALKKSSWRLNRARVNYYKNRIKYDLRLLRDKEWRKLVLKHDWLSEEAGMEKSG